MNPRGAGAEPLRSTEYIWYKCTGILPYEFFVVPIQDQGQAKAALNGFLRAHRVMAVDRRWIEQGATSFWSFCIDFLDGPASAGTHSSRPAAAGPKIDYKVILKPEEFVVYARLRELRKELATAESVPLYAIFTNEQLAQMVQMHATSRADLEKVTGVGEARLNKYGGRMLEILSSAWKPVDEANRPTV